MPRVVQEADQHRRPFPGIYAQAEIVITFPNGLLKLLPGLTEAQQEINKIYFINFYLSLLPFTAYAVEKEDMKMRKIGVLTLSDRSAAGVYEDASGMVAREALLGGIPEAEITRYAVIPDERAQ